MILRLNRTATLINVDALIVVEVGYDNVYNAWHCVDFADFMALVKTRAVEKGVDLKNADYVKCLRFLSENSRKLFIFDSITFKDLWLQAHADRDHEADIARADLLHAVTPAIELGWVVDINCKKNNMEKVKKLVNDKRGYYYLIFRGFDLVDTIFIANHPEASIENLEEEVEYFIVFGTYPGSGEFAAIQALVLERRGELQKKYPDCDFELVDVGADCNPHPITVADIGTVYFPR